MARRRKVPSLLGSDPEYARELMSSSSSVEQPKQKVVSSDGLLTAPERRSPQVTETGDVKKAQVHLFACPRAEHSDQLYGLEKRGYDIRDIIKLAGRRASAEFVPSDNFVPASKVPLMHSRFAYKTTRLYSIEILSALRATNDPVGLMSHAALLRGQFETIFWLKLEGVVKELYLPVGRHGR